MVRERFPKGLPTGKPLNLSQSFRLSQLPRAFQLAIVSPTRLPRGGQIHADWIPDSENQEGGISPGENQPMSGAS